MPKKCWQLARKKGPIKHKLNNLGKDDDDLAKGWIVILDHLKCLNLLT